MPGHLGKRRRVLVLDAATKIAGRHGRQDAKRHLGADAIHLEQSSKQRPLILGREAVQNLCVFAHQQMRVQEHLRAGSGRSRNVDIGVSTS